MNDKADNTQKKLIHMAKAQLGIDEAAYRAVLVSRYHVMSAKELSYSQATDFIEYFKRLGFRIKGTHKSICRYMCEPRNRREKLPENVVLMVSPGQLAKIGRLRDDIHWKVQDGFARWMKKYFGVTTIRYSTEATMVIEALKSMWKSQHKCVCSLVGKGRR